MFSILKLWWKERKFRKQAVKLLSTSTITYKKKIVKTYRSSSDVRGRRWKLASKVQMRIQYDGNKYRTFTIQESVAPRTFTEESASAIHSEHLYQKPIKRTTIAELYGKAIEYFISKFRRESTKNLTADEETLGLTSPVSDQEFNKICDEVMNR